MNLLGLMPVVNVVIQNLTPEIRKELGGALNRMESAARNTSNPFDDIAVKLLRVVLGL